MVARQTLWAAVQQLPVRQRVDALVDVVVNIYAPLPAPSLAGVVARMLKVPDGTLRILVQSGARVRIASGTHYIEGVQLVRGPDSLVRYALRTGLIPPEG